jgi:hypothetical protein
MRYWVGGHTQALRLNILVLMFQEWQRLWIGEVDEKRLLDMRDYLSLRPGQAYLFESRCRKPVGRDPSGKGAA